MNGLGLPKIHMLTSNRLQNYAWRTKWRTKQSGKVPAQSTINNHNSAMNCVLDLAELNGWIVKSLRPTLLNKGVKTQSRSYIILKKNSNFSCDLSFDGVKFYKVKASL